MQKFFPKICCLKEIPLVLKSDMYSAGKSVFAFFFKKQQIGHDTKAIFCFSSKKLGLDLFADLTEHKMLPR